MKFKLYSVAITTTGADGSATGSGTIFISPVGKVEYVYLDYHASAPNTTDVTLANAATPPGGNILAVSNNATDGQYFPRAACVNNANVAITDSYDKFVVTGLLTVSVAQCNALTAAVTVYIGVSRSE